MERLENDIPQQKRGAQKDIQHSVTAPSSEDAKVQYENVLNRLKNVNSWHHYAGETGAKFQLADNNGQPIQRDAHEKDLIQIDIPGPSSATDEYDWVMINEMKSTIEEDGEAFFMSLQPVAAPGSDHTTHFFKEDASSNFLLKRINNDITLNYYGRNEIPNMDSPTLADKARNLLVGAGAILGFSDKQWAELVKGILNQQK